jgi:hypothetical protein
MKADAPANAAFREKAPRGETGLFLRCEQLGEARRTNADGAETFQANQGSGRVSLEQQLRTYAVPKGSLEIAIASSNRCQLPPSICR